MNLLCSRTVVGCVVAVCDRSVWCRFDRDAARYDVRRPDGVPRRADAGAHDAAQVQMIAARRSLVALSPASLILIIPYINSETIYMFLDEFSH